MEKQHNFSNCSICKQLGVTSNQEYFSKYGHRDYGIEFTDAHWDHSVSISVIGGQVLEDE